MSKLATVIRDQIDFLTTLWEPQNRVSQDLFGAFCFKRRGSTKMVQEFEWLNEDVKIGRLLRKYDRHKWDQYFSPNVYTRPKRLVNCVHLCRLGWCDIDKGDPSSFDPLPSVVWETSPGNTQALWFWDRPHTPKRASDFSRALTYRHGGDPGGSAPNKLLRVPGSFNHKPAYAKPFIPLRHYDTRLIFQRPELLPDQRQGIGRQIETSGMNPHAHDSLAVLKKYRSKLTASTRSLIRHNRVMAQDRSGRIFAMVWGPSYSEETKRKLTNFAIGLARERANKLIKLGDEGVVDAGSFKKEIRLFAARLNLPTFLASMSPKPAPEAVASVHSQRPIFVRQLEIIDIGQDQEIRAVADYLRASADKTIWAEEGDIVQSDLEDWETSLTRAFDLHRGEVQDLHSGSPVEARGRQGKPISGRLAAVPTGWHTTSPLCLHCMCSS